MEYHPEFENNDPIILYHKGCVDGAVSAFIAFKHLAGNAIYWPYQYGDDIDYLITDRDVIALDVSFSESAIKDIAGKARSIMVVDHHKTTMSALPFMEVVKTYDEYLDIKQNSTTNMFVLFDITYSGAALSWYFFTGQQSGSKLPELVTYTQDYDLWEHQYVKTRAVNAIIGHQININGFYSIADLIDDDLGMLDAAVQAGSTLLLKDKLLAENVVKNYTEFLNINGIKFAFVNGPHHVRNEISEILLTLADVDIVAVYNRRSKLTVVSLRSTGVDVEEIASWYSDGRTGGGHKKASAFTIKHDDKIDIHYIGVKPGLFKWFKIMMLKLRKKAPK